MARKTEQEKQETYRKLLASASVLFIEQGVASTTLHQIAKHAGMTRGAVYWHFKNKEAIIVAVWEEGASQVHDEFLNGLGGLSREKPNRRFRQILHAVIDRVLEDPAYSQSLRILMHCIEFSHQKTSLHDFLMMKQKGYIDGLTASFQHLREQQAVTSDLSDQALANGLLSYMFGMIHHHIDPASYIDLHQDGHALLDIYLNGVLILEE